MNTYTGILHFHSETGTEGGHWAMQDERFMGLKNEHSEAQFHCPRCGRVWDKSRDLEEPKPSFTYFDEESGYYQGSDHPIADGRTWFRGEEPDSVNDLFTKSSNATSQECFDKGHQQWDPMYPDGTWSYEGLHVLKDGDKLTVLDPKDPEKELWTGEIKLIHHPLFSEDAGGMWIHADQEGFPREEWAKMFFMEFPCRLETQEGATP